LFVGKPIELVAVPSGNEERPPGEWAKHVKKLDYTVAKQGATLKTEALVTLDKMEAKRELMVRSNKPYLPSSLEHSIGESARKVESALGYIVGDLSTPACSSCERGLGPFPHCVRFSDCENVTACTNCHGSGDLNCCQYYDQPDQTHQTDPAEYNTKLKGILSDAEVSLALAEKAFRGTHEIAFHARQSHDAVHGMNAAAAIRDTQRLADEYGVSNEHAKQVAMKVKDVNLDLYQLVDRLKNVTMAVEKLVKEEAEAKSKR
jgi:hypothetical protein